MFVKSAESEATFLQRIEVHSFMMSIQRNFLVQSQNDFHGLDIFEDKKNGVREDLLLSAI